MTCSEILEISAFVVFILSDIMLCAYLKRIQASFMPKKKRYVIGPILLLLANGFILAMHSESTCHLFYIRWGAFTFAFVFCLCIVELCLFFITHEHTINS